MLCKLRNLITNILYGQYGCGEVTVRVKTEIGLIQVCVSTPFPLELTDLSLLTDNPPMTHLTFSKIGHFSTNLFTYTNNDPS